MASKPADSQRVPAQKTSGGRIAAGFIAVALLPGIVLVDGGFALMRGWIITQRLDRLVIQSAAALTAISVLLLLIPAGRRFLGRSAPLLMVLLIVTSTTLVLTEAVLTATVPGLRRQFHTHHPGVRLFKPDPALIPGVAGESRFTVDAAGFRGPPLPARQEAYRILCIGGSTTICTYLDDTETWPAVLMSLLNDTPGLPKCWVGNVGVSGFAAAHHLKFARESELFGEVDCAIFLVGANDLLKFLEGSGMEREEALVDRSPFTLRSGIVGLVRRAWRVYVGARDIWAEDFSGINYAKRREKRRNAEISDEPPDLDAALREYAHRIRGIITTARQRGVRPIFLNQPVLWRAGLAADEAGLLWLGELSGGRFLSAERCREAMDRYNEVLPAVCAETGTEFVDLSSAISGVPEFFYDDAHYTEAGAREVARVIHEYLLQHPARLSRGG